MRGLGRRASEEKWVGEGRLREWGAERLMRGRGHGGARREGLPGGSGGHRPSADPAARLAAAGAPGSHPRRTRAFRSRPGPHPHGVPTRLGRPCSQSRRAVGTRAAGALVDRRGCAPASSCRVARGWAWKGPGDLGGDTPRGSCPLTQASRHADPALPAARLRLRRVDSPLPHERTFSFQDGVEGGEAASAASEPGERLPKRPSSRSGAALPPGAARRARRVSWGR